MLYFLYENMFAYVIYENSIMPSYECLHMYIILRHIHATLCIYYIIKKNIKNNIKKKTTFDVKTF